MTQKKALITGITGQDGAYLAEHLLSKGYIVHGIKRRSSLFNTYRLNNMYKDRHESEAKLFLHYGDMLDNGNLLKIITDVQPDEIYNLAAMSHVHVSFEMPEYTANTVGIGTLRLLEILRQIDKDNHIKFYQASTSELYGKVAESPQSENTPFNPRSPYAIAKQFAYYTVLNYREAYGLYAANGILYNHESPIRGETFLTRKVTIAVAKIALKLESSLLVGNLNARRDWGHAKDYVKAMHLILQQPKPDDFVIATGISETVRNFIIHAFSVIGISLIFKGDGTNEVGIIESMDSNLFEHKVGAKPDHLQEGMKLVYVDKEYFRPTEVENLLGNPSKAMTELGWKPTYTLADMIYEMVDSDIKLFKTYNNSEYVDGAIGGSY